MIFDVETYFDRDYSLRKMPTPNYILDPRFELQMVAVKVDDQPHQIIDGPKFLDSKQMKSRIEGLLAAK